MDILKEILLGICMGFTEQMGALHLGGTSVVDAISSILEPANVFQCQPIVEEWFGIDINSIAAEIFKVAYWLLLLKFVWKGFDNYMIGGSGDEDADPMVLFFNFIKALVISLCFGIIFEQFMNIAFDLYSRIKNLLVLKNDFPGSVSEFLEMGIENVLMLFFFLVYLIMALVLTIQFMKHTLELVILRIGISFAAAGLLDSDKGVFTPYIKKFFQITFTVLLQTLFFRLSVMALATVNVLPAIMALAIAFSAPSFLSEFIMQNNGGGKIQQTLYMISTLRMLRR